MSVRSGDNVPSTWLFSCIAQDVPSVKTTSTCIAGNGFKSTFGLPSLAVERSCYTALLMMKVESAEGTVKSWASERIMTD